MPFSPNVVTQRFNDIVERLKSRGAYEAYSEFAKALEYSPQSLNEILKGRRDVPVEVLRKLFTAYDVSPEYVFLGKGEAFLNVPGNVPPNVPATKQGQNQTYIKQEEPAFAHEPHTLVARPNPAIQGGISRTKRGDIDLNPAQTLQERINMPPVIIEYKGAPTEFPPIKMIDQKAAAGYPAYYTDPGFWDALPEAVIPIVNLKTGFYVMIQVQGDSMEPRIGQGDWIICRYIDDINDIRDGHVHVVVTREGIVSKQVLNRIKKRESLALRSFNPTYSTYDQRLEDIIQIWRAELFISANFSNPQEDLTKRVNAIEAEMIEVRRALKGR